MGFTLLDQGSFTSDGTSQTIDLPGDADYFVTENLTQIATTQNPGRGVKFEWFKNQLSDDEAIEYLKANSSNALEVTKVTSGGFTYVKSFPAPGAEVSATGANSVTNADPAVVTVSNSFSDGDRVRLYGTTDMLQISGMVFSISSTSGSGFTLAGLDASGFADDATAVKARKLTPQDRVEPRALFVTNISQAASAVVTVSTLHNYVVDELVHLQVPNGYGMTEVDQVEAKVTAVGDYTLTLDLDTQNFTAFSFPTSAEASQKREFAMLSPAGSRTSYDVDNVPFRSGQFFPYMQLAAGAQSPAGSNNDEIVWQAWKKDN